MFVSVTKEMRNDFMRIVNAINRDIHDILLEILTTEISDTLNEYFSDACVELMSLYSSIEKAVREDNPESVFNYVYKLKQIRDSFSDDKAFNDIAKDNTRVIGESIGERMQELAKVSHYYYHISRDKFYSKYAKMFASELFKKCNYYCASVCSSSFMNYIELFDYVINSTVELISDKAELEEQERDEVLTRIEEKIATGKIFDYKKLNRLAEEFGYRFERQCGDHAQYINDQGRLVTIPQGRSIGKGLSKKIQKDIQRDYRVAPSL